MEASAKKFFQQILETPSPSGYEEPVQRVVREYAGAFADEVRTDLHGNVIACVNPGAKVRLMFAGHCDQIGLLVTYINDNGFIYANTIGGWDPLQLIGQRLVARGPSATRKIDESVAEPARPVNVERGPHVDPYLQAVAIFESRIAAPG